MTQNLLTFLLWSSFFTITLIALIIIIFVFIACTPTISIALCQFSSFFSTTTWVSQYQKGKTSLDLNQARDDGVLGWQWHQLDHVQTICTSLQADNHANTSSLNFLQTGCTSWRPTNSVEALKAITIATCVSVTEQYNSIPDKGQWCPAAWTVTVGLLSHWPCVTDLSGFIRAYTGRWAPRLQSSQEYDMLCSNWHLAGIKNGMTMVLSQALWWAISVIVRLQCIDAVGWATGRALGL